MTLVSSLSPTYERAGVNNLHFFQTMKSFFSVFACFMVAIMIGSSVFSLLLSKGFRAEETLRIILVILALSMGICCVMASPNRNTNDMVIIYAAFLILEVAIGMYFPAMSYLKSQIIPEGHRANVRVHHMFLRILNHLGIFVIVFSREKKSSFLLK